MKKLRNPLLEDRPARVLTASSTEKEIPISPFSGKPMTFGYCDATPVYADAEKRIIVPLRVV